MNYGDIETRLAALITARAVALRDEERGEIGLACEARPAAGWALAEAREVLRRMEVANGGCLAAAILEIAEGGEREFAVPGYRVPLMPMELTHSEKPLKPSLWGIVERLAARDRRDPWTGNLTNKHTP